MTFKFDTYINKFHSISNTFNAKVDEANKAFAREIEKGVYSGVHLFEMRNQIADAAAAEYTTASIDLNAQAVSHAADIREKLLEAMTIKGDPAFYSRLQICITLLQAADPEKDYTDDFLQELTAEFAGDYKIMRQIHHLIERRCFNNSIRHMDQAFPIYNPMTHKHRFPETFGQYVKDLTVLATLDEVDKNVKDMFVHGFRKIGANHTNAGYQYDLWVPDTNRLSQNMEEARLPGLLADLNVAIQNAGLKI